MNCRTCTKCGALWMEDQHFWATGKPGNELDLAGLVCNTLTDASECINPKRGLDGGDTWEYRRGFIDGALNHAMKQEENRDN